MTFAENELGKGVVQRALKELEPVHGEYQHHRLPGALNPLPTAAAAWMAVSDIKGGSVAERRAFFQRMGVYIADTNLHGIYKTLLALIVNPHRLAKRVPQLWSTYFRGLTVQMNFDEIKSGCLRFEVEGFGGAPHIGEMAEGWLAFAFELVGGEEVEAKEDALEAGEPHPGRTMGFQVKWRV